MQALFLLATWAALVALGCVAPFVMALAYVWVDLFRPHEVAPALGRLLPFSFVTAVLAIGAYLVLDRRDPPRLGLLTAMLVILACWIILTTSWACSPRACVKRYWCFQAIQFTILLPFFFRSRIHNEAAQIVTCLHRVEELPCHQVRPRLGRLRPPARLIASMRMGRGGQHARHLAFACLPLVAFLQRHSLLAASRGWLRWLYLAAPGLAIVGAFGTFARAALVACAVWAALAWWQSRRKILVAIMMVAVAAAVVPLMGDAWLARISTSLEPRHHDRESRLLVWALDHRPGQTASPRRRLQHHLANRIEMRAGRHENVEEAGDPSNYFDALASMAGSSAIFSGSSRCSSRQRRSCARWLQAELDGSATSPAPTATRADLQGRRGQLVNAFYPRNTICSRWRSSPRPGSAVHARAGAASRRRRAAAPGAADGLASAGPAAGPSP